MLSVKCQHNLVLIHLDFFLISLLCKKRQSNWNGNKYRTGWCELGAGNWSGTGRAWESDGSSGSSLVIKGLEEWWSSDSLGAVQPFRVAWTSPSWERWAEKKLWKSHKGKCRSCTWGGTTPAPAETGWPVGISTVEKGWATGAGPCGVEFQKSGVLSETECFEELQRHQNSCIYKSQQRIGFFGIENEH